MPRLKDLRFLYMTWSRESLSLLPRALMQRQPLEFFTLWEPKGDNHSYIGVISVGSNFEEFGLSSLQKFSTGEILTFAKILRRPDCKLKGIRVVECGKWGLLESVSNHKAVVASLERRGEVKYINTCFDEPWLSFGRGFLDFS